MYYVIGSGPTGVAAASMLLQRGCKVRLLDAGISLDSIRQEKLNKLQNQNSDKWDREILNSFKEGVSSNPKGVQKKLVYGSDFPYQDIEKHFSIIEEDVGNFSPSLAKGGFSNVWGSAVLSYTDKDLQDWPIKHSDLAKYYQSVTRDMPMAYQEDSLSQFFPSYGEKNLLKTSKQASLVLEKLNKNIEQLKSRGLYFGSPRLAVNSGKDASNCAYCGMCLYGCPKSIIHSSSFTLEKLSLDNNFEYIPNIIVSKVEEESSAVKIEGYNRTTKEKISFVAKKAYLAAGAISTTRILLNSKKVFNQTLRLKASEYFLLPMLSKSRVPNVREENLHTLSQLFIECFDKELSDFGIHMQLYSYSDLYYQALKSMFAWTGPGFFLLEKLVLERMFAIQGYLHSNDSSSIEVSLINSEEVRLKGIVNKDAASIIKRLVGKLNALSKYTSLFAIRPMLQIGLPGEGRHVGGSFPMASNPTEFESDLLGRPFSFKNIHIVDASNFPTVPAPTITYTAMANAQRIADLSLSNE